MAHQQGYRANAAHRQAIRNEQYNGQYAGGAAGYGGGRGHYDADLNSDYPYTTGHWVDPRQFSAAQADPAHTENAMYPPQEMVVHGKQHYIVERVLVPPANDPARMSNGLRILSDPTRGIQLVEKNMAIINDDAAHRAKSEINTLKQIRDAGGSPCINAIYDAFWTNGSRSCVVLLEWCDSETVQELIMSHVDTRALIPENLCWHVLEGMLTALTMCHFGIRNPHDTDYKYQDWNTICHLDIKPANVFLSTRMVPGQETHEVRVVLGDFGCAVTRHDVDTGKSSMHRLPGGTVGWIPPEIKRSKDGSWAGGFGKPMDIWQTGGIIQAMCLLSHEPNLKMLEGGRPCGPGYSMELNHVISMALDKNPMTRGSALNIWKAAKKGKEAWLKSQQ